MAYSFAHANSEKTKIADWLHSEYRSLQTGRATPSVLDGVQVMQYGSRTPIAHCASISIEDPKTLRVAPWDKGVIRDIEKAINEADLGVSVATDDMGLRVSFPMLTTETREKMIKVLRDKLEDARVKVRALREEINKDIDAKADNGEYGEDERMRNRDELQKLINGANADLEAIFEKKEKEVMGQ